MIKASIAMQIAKESRTISNGKLNDIIIAAAKNGQNSVSLGNKQLTDEQVTLLKVKQFTITNNVIKFE